MTISKYKLWIIGLYVILFPLFFLFPPTGLNYDFSSERLWQILLVAAGAILGFIWLNAYFGYLKIQRQKFKFYQIFFLVVYAFIFALPEEIIFRGIIQNALQINIGNSALAIILSSAIFGLAHLPNGALGLYPKGWNWKLAAMTFLAGLPLGAIFFLAQGLLFPTLLHACFLIIVRLFTKEDAY